MKKITVKNVKNCTETGENEDQRLCMFEFVEKYETFTPNTLYGFKVFPYRWWQKLLMRFTPYKLLYKLNIDDQKDYTS